MTLIWTTGRLGPGSGVPFMQRKLAAILSADVVGYSGLMEADEAGTLERVKANRAAIFEPQVALHSGRIFKLMGDGALVEFSSVVAAVNCALAIQEAMGQAEQDLPPAIRIRYRIGVNVGDVIVDGDDMYGDGVNVASRIQTLAPAGGVAVPRAVRDQIRGKVACEFEDAGEHTVKNIKTPIHVFFSRPGGGAESHEEAPRHKLATILFADVVGHSAVMATDEAGTLKLMRANRRAILNPQVAAFGGRVFKLLGDLAMVEFSSAVAAVKCALAIQEETERAPQSGSDSWRVRYRIGIHLCETVSDDGEVYGEGFRVVALLSNRAPIGGIALSGIVRDNVEGKLPCDFEDMGEHSPEYSKRPVRMFFIRGRADAQTA